MLKLTLKPDRTLLVGEVRITHQGKNSDGSVNLGIEGPVEILANLAAPIGQIAAPAEEKESRTRRVLSLRRSS